MSVSTPPWTASSFGEARATNSAPERIGSRFLQGRAPDSGGRYAAICLCVEFANHLGQVPDIFVAVIAIDAGVPFVWRLHVESLGDHAVPGRTARRRQVDQLSKWLRQLGGRVGPLVDGGRGGPHRRVLSGLRGGRWIRPGGRRHVCVRRGPDRRSEFPAGY